MQETTGTLLMKKALDTYFIHVGITPNYRLPDHSDEETAIQVISNPTCSWPSNSGDVSFA